MYLKIWIQLNSLAKTGLFVCLYFDQRITLMVSQDPKLYLICLQSYIYYLREKEGNESGHIYISCWLFTGSRVNSISV